MKVHIEFDTENADDKAALERLFVEPIPYEVTHYFPPTLEEEKRKHVTCGGGETYGATTPWREEVLEPITHLEVIEPASIVQPPVVANDSYCVSKQEPTYDSIPLDKVDARRKELHRLLIAFRDADRDRARKWARDNQCLNANKVPVEKIMIFIRDVEAIMGGK